MRLLYGLSIKLYSATIHTAALLGKRKAQKWVNGRKDWTKKLKRINPEKKKLAWFHVASLGEFEQARPIIEALKKSQPNTFILLSFFSPSGFEVRKNYDKADHVCYLPIDTEKNAKLFLKIANPSVIIFIKYEFWFNYLNTIFEQKIKCYLVSGIFRKKQHFFKTYGTWFSKNLKAFTHFYLQNKDSKKLLGSIGFSNTSVNGDTRLDRVLSISQEPFTDNRFESFSIDSKVVIFGSSWQRENELAELLHTHRKGVKIILAPHEIDHEKIKTLKSRFSNCLLLSDTQPLEDLSDTQVLIVDQIGLLSKLYRFSDFAVIGGGFGSGIHNTLEAVVYGCPVIFGSNYRKFQEAFDLIAIKAGFSVKTYEEFLEISDQLLNDETFYSNSKSECEKYVIANSGASQIVLDRLLEDLK